MFACARSYLPETQRHRRLINPAVNIDGSPVPFCGLEEKSADFIPRSFIFEPSIDWEQSGRFAKVTVAQTGICAQLLITENELFKDFFRFRFGFQCNVKVFFRQVITSSILCFSQRSRTSSSSLISPPSSKPEKPLPLFLFKRFLLCFLVQPPFPLFHVTPKFIFEL